NDVIMKAVILLGTLKTTGVSNTETLSEFLISHLEEKNVACELIKLVDHNILPGTYTDMGKDDAWPSIFEKLLKADIIVFATPIWWNNQSSEIQRVIERLDELHDEIMEGKTPKLKGKAGGIVITGDSDGAQHIIANLSNFYNAMGLILPPFATLSVLWSGQAKGKKTTKKDLLKKYEEDYADTAKKMVQQLMQFAQN
ncbi:MAG TPA: flavodoxin family protein, partial [Aquaticitalea sp.]|nr:flavodoxin family protein [Aquaticitalea sp.]